jgi:hypothetical protein
MAVRRLRGPHRTRYRKNPIGSRAPFPSLADLRHEPGSPEAKAIMQKLVEGCPVVCELTGERTHGRRIGHLHRRRPWHWRELREAGLALWRHPYLLVLPTVQLKQCPPLPRPSVRLLEFGKAWPSIFSVLTRYAHTIM